MPSPLNFSGEKDLLLALAQPIGQRLRPEFLAAVAQELEAMRTTPAAPASCTWSRVPTRIAQRVVALPQRLTGEVQRWNTTGEAAIYLCRASRLFLHRPALGSPRKLDGEAGMQLGASRVPATFVASVLTRSQI
jgi:hypothetical protein